MKMFMTESKRSVGRPKTSPLERDAQLRQAAATIREKKKASLKLAFNSIDCALSAVVNSTEDEILRNAIINHLIDAVSYIKFNQPASESFKDELINLARVK